MTETVLIGRRLLLACAAVAPCCSSPSDLREAPAVEPGTGEAEATEIGTPDELVSGWLSWRGPLQTGASLETGLLETLTVDGENHAWSYELAGRGTPVIAGERVYTMGYEGEGADLQELIVCLDATSGERIWEQRFSDFLSDVVYNRYSISSPTIDPASGDVFFLTSPGLLCAFTSDGEPRWQRSLMSEFGRLTFPNGRTGAVVVDGELVILHTISAHWGPQAPARDRFYAFDKTTGEHVWSSTPGERPVDSSFSYPVLGWEGERRVLYAGTGCGNLVCIDARTGEPVWRCKLSIGGVNASVLPYDGALIAIHGKENVDTSTIGRMLSIRSGTLSAANAAEPVVLDASYENWRNDLVSFSSSPVLVGDRVYTTDQHGELSCVDARSGEVLWHVELAPDQIHASPLAADGKLYVPMNNGSFYVIRPSDEGPEILCEAQLEGNCLGAPALCDGRVYVHTTKKLYCFSAGAGAAPPLPEREPAPAPGQAVRLQLVPGDVLLRQGESVSFRVRSLDANGAVVEEGFSGELETGGLPLLTMSAGRRTGLDAVATETGIGVLAVSSGGLRGSARVRVVSELPFAEDFEGFELAPHPREAGVTFAHPPSTWIGVKVKWEVREVDGAQALVRTLTNPLFQRSMGFIGHPEMSNYTIQADLMSEGNRRTMSPVGVVNQRYLIVLKGNHRELEVSSNDERLKVSVPFRSRPKVWYTLKSRVDLAEDGSGVVRAKVWQRDEPEPDEWTLSVPHNNAHTHGAPGLYGFALQSRFRVYVDNLSVTPNE